MGCTPAKTQSGRPPALSARDKVRFLRNSKSIGEQNLNANVGLAAMECELHQVSATSLSIIFNQSGCKYMLHIHSFALSVL